MRDPYLKFALAAFAAIWIAAIAISWIGWGPWAAFSYVEALITFAIGAAIFLAARRGFRRPRHVESTDAPFAAAPVDQVLAILDEPGAASAAIADLHRRFPEATIRTYVGPDGAAALDSEGTAHGVGATIERSLEHLLTDESDLARYEAAVLSGAVVLAADAGSRDAEDAAIILAAHGAHDIYRFGSLLVEQLDPNPMRTH
jgi:hypothetical protein